MISNGLMKKLMTLRLILIRFIICLTWNNCFSIHWYFIWHLHTNVRYTVRFQLVDATLYPSGKRWSVDQLKSPLKEDVQYAHYPLSLHKGHTMVYNRAIQFVSEDEYIETCSIYYTWCFILWCPSFLYFLLVENNNPAEAGLFRRSDHPNLVAKVASYVR